MNIALIDMSLTLIDMSLTLIDMNLTLIGMNLTLIGMNLTLIGMNLTLISVNIVMRKPGPGKGLDSRKKDLSRMMEVKRFALKVKKFALEAWMVDVNLCVLCDCFLSQRDGCAICVGFSL